MSEAEKATKDTGEKGGTTLLWEAPEITIQGRTYKLRRLGIRDTLKVAKILAAGVSTLGPDAGPLNEMTTDKMAYILLSAAPFAEKQTMEVLASVVGVTPEELDDPELFPMGSEIDILTALVQHEDMQAFFGRLRSVMKSGVLKKIARPEGQGS